jgi:hypothetical protein
LMGGVAITGVTLLSGALLSSGALTHGRIELIGDPYRAVPVLGTWVSLTLPLMASCYEEAAIRGALQLRVQYALGSFWSEVLAATVFLGLHGFTIAKQPWQICFLAFAALTNGRVAAMTQTVKYPALSHALSNGALTLIYIALRAWAT